MSRTALVVVAGLIVAGCVVAMLPAQESSRRRASDYQPEADGSPIVDPGAFVPAGESGLQNQLQAAGQQVADEFAASPGSAGAVPAFAAAPDDPAPFQPPEDPSTLQGMPNAAAPVPGRLSASAVANDAAAPMATFAEPGAATTTSDNPPSDAAPSEPPATEPMATQPESTEFAPIVERPSAGVMRSVLKRPQAAIVSEAHVPGASAPAMSRPAASSGTSSRRPSAIASASASTPPALRPSAPGRSIQDLTISGRTPSLRVDVAGPQGITVNKPATYVVSVVNESDTPAEEVQVRVGLPAWVSVNGSQPSKGEAMMQADAQGTARLLWSIPKVAGRAREQLQIQLVTREGEGFELGVDWACRPASTRASIVVRQPQLDLSIAGPGDMIFGEEKVFTLSVSNPGNGDAEQVVVNLTTGDGRTQPIEVGHVPAGQKKEIPLQVVANQAGEMELKATASGEGGLTAEAAGRILVRKAELNLAVEGPPLKFAGTEAVYLVTVTNSGNALADSVSLSLALPTGAKYLGGIEGAAAAPSGELKWKVASLPPGGERQYEVRVQLHATGLNRLVVQAIAAAAGSASQQAETEVEAVSDLKLVINDPTGPLPTTEQAVYEVQVTNRGSQAAEQVKIVVQFSEGIEPIAFDGCEARIVPGQVLCKPLPSLGAGEQVTLRIKAKPQAAGTHQFRVEVTAADADTRLVSEGTTRFFSEAGRQGAAASTAKKPGLLPAPAGTIQR